MTTNDFMGRAADRITSMLFENVEYKVVDPTKQPMADMVEKIVRHALRNRIYTILVEEYDK